MADFHDMQRLLSEARYRWLRADEISQMLLNHQALPISKKAPLLPCSIPKFSGYNEQKKAGRPAKKKALVVCHHQCSLHYLIKFGGSVFFYDRRVTRYFRKDGHNWSKRPNGKTVNEGHMKLKVKDIYMLNCSYSHGEENPSFQRRCYSMLEPNLMHNVFVQYLDVKMTCTSSISASPAVPLETSSSSLVGLEPDEHNESFKQTRQVSAPGKKLKSSCSYLGGQSAKPPWGGAQLQQATSQFSFGLAISESPSGKGHLNHLPDNVLDSATSAFSFQEGVGLLKKDKMPLLDLDDHGFQDTGASGFGTFGFWPSDINEEDFSTSPFAGLHQSVMSDNLEVLLGSIDFKPSDSNEDEFFPLPFPGPHQSSTSDDLQFDEVLFWRARRRWTKIYGAVKFLAVFEAAAMRRSYTLHQT